LIELLESDSARPRQARYQAALRPDMKYEIHSKALSNFTPNPSHSFDNVLKLSREPDIHRRLLHNSRERSEEGDAASTRPREFILRKEITKLKQVLANKMMEADFFRRTLQRAGARRRQRTASGAQASMTK
jgi:DNA topoisomerase IB